MAFTVRVTNIGNTIDKAILTLKNMPLKVLIELPKVADDTRKVMISIIQASKRRAGSSNNLEDSISVDILTFNPLHFTVGIGNIANLNRTAPYWALLNYGGMVSPGARFVPGFFGEGNPPDASLKGTGVGTEKFTYAPGVGSFMRVGSPIAPVNYIEKSALAMINILNIRLNRAIRLL